MIAAFQALHLLKINPRLLFWWKCSWRSADK
jgi:hypothetical protein